MELWRVGPEAADEEGGEEGGGGEGGGARRPRASVLDGNKEAQALLEMAGRAMHSRALRTPPESEDEAPAEP